MISSQDQWVDDSVVMRTCIQATITCMWLRGVALAVRTVTVAGATKGSSSPPSICAVSCQDVVDNQHSLEPTNLDSLGSAWSIYPAPESH